MRIVSFSDEIIRSDKSPYILDGKIEPTFYVAGNVVANFRGVPHPPGSSFEAGVKNSIMKGGVDITFENQAVDTSQDPNPMVICFYGSLVTEDHTTKENNCN